MDDYQDCGTRPIDVRAIGVDFYVTGTLKYLLGPPRLAFLYVRKELQDTLIPTMTGWFAQRQPFAFDVKHLDRAPTARKFEGGSPPIPNIYAAKRSLALIEDVGRDAPSQLMSRRLRNIFCKVLPRWISPSKHRQPPLDLLW